MNHPCPPQGSPDQSTPSYPAAVILSSWLWRRLADLSVLVTVISEDDAGLAAAGDLAAALAAVGARPVVRRTEANISCVLAGQIARILAFNHPQV